jgi:galactose mutarotase-like enzyme
MLAQNAEASSCLAGRTAWPRHSPLLFPIVGRLKNDQLRYRGKTYPMTQHGLRAIIDFPGFSVSRIYVSWFFTMSGYQLALPIRISPGSHLCGERRRIGSHAAN